MANHAKAGAQSCRAEAEGASTAYDHESGNARENQIVIEGDIKPKLPAVCPTSAHMNQDEPHTPPPSELLPHPPCPRKRHMRVSKQPCPPIQSRQIQGRALASAWVRFAIPHGYARRGTRLHWAAVRLQPRLRTLPHTPTPSLRHGAESRPCCSILGPSPKRSVRPPGRRVFSFSLFLSLSLFSMSFSYFLFFLNSSQIYLNLTSCPLT
ncbi:unnamed protein product [Rhizoctonia solani]|uniref:Uncharacterized protein n=1 Tax=Rhizoctonia solani TaxID=456999 RepID=A0A8H3BXM2_9AGAM|nr:unnamed protein product [Rhizoctonia solani]